MASEVTVHSDAADGTRTITLTKTGDDTGKITLVAPSHSQDYAVTGITADVPSLTLVCRLDAIFSADIDVSVSRQVGAKVPVATVAISHALLGNGTFTYPLRKGEDKLMQAFLTAAAFPPIT